MVFHLKSRILKPHDWIYSCCCFTSYFLFGFVCESTYRRLSIRDWILYYLDLFWFAFNRTQIHIMSFDYVFDSPVRASSCLCVSVSHYRNHFDWFIVNISVRKKVILLLLFFQQIVILFFALIKSNQIKKQPTKQQCKPNKTNTYYYILHSTHNWCRKWESNDSLYV